MQDQAEERWPRHNVMTDGERDVVEEEKQHWIAGEGGAT